jgi:hypothetical protein
MGGFDIGSLMGLMGGGGGGGGIMGMLGGLMGGGGGGGGTQGGQPVRGGGKGGSSTSMAGPISNPTQEAFLASPQGQAGAQPPRKQGFWGTLGQGMQEAYNGGQWSHPSTQSRPPNAGGATSQGTDLNQILAILAMLGAPKSSPTAAGALGGPPMQTRPGSPYQGAGTPWNMGF